MILREEIIGEQRLILGDCLKVMPLLGKVDAVLTDPPYGIDFGNFNRTNKDHRGARYKADKYHNSDWDKDFDFSIFYPEICRFNCPTIIWGGNYFPCLWAAPTKGIIFWNKKQPCKNFSKGELAWSNIDMPAQHIDFAYFGNIEGSTSATEKQHPTQKPIEVMRQCIGYTEGQTILDPFMGSGTTLVACAKMGRKGIGIELEPKYFDIACRRVEEAYKQPDLFIEQTKKIEQGELL